MRLMLRHYPSGAADGCGEGRRTAEARPWRNYVALSKQWAQEGHDCLLSEIEGLNLLLRDMPMCRRERSNRDLPASEPGIRVGGDSGQSGEDSAISLSASDGAAEVSRPSLVAAASSPGIAPLVPSAAIHVDDTKADCDRDADACCIKECSDSEADAVPDECATEAASPAATVGFEWHPKRPHEDDSGVVTPPSKRSGGPRAAAAVMDGSPSEGPVMIDLTMDD